MKDIHYEELIRKIEADIKERKLISEPLQMSDMLIVSEEARVYEEEQFAEFLQGMEVDKDVQPFPEITGNIISRMLKKIVVRITTFFYLPAVSKQNNYNRLNLSSVRSMYWMILEQEKTIISLKRKLDICEQKLERLEESK